MLALDFEAPMIGRLSELAVARRVIDAALEGSAAVIALSGAPGVGKTRMVQQLIADLAPERALILRGQGVDLPGVPVLRAPFGVMTEALRWSLATAPEALASQIKEWIEPSASDPVEPVHLRHARLIEVIDALTAIGPVVLILEDLHWADDSSLAALAVLVRHLTHQRLVVIVTVRPPTPANPLVAELCGWLRHREGVAWLDLEPLPDRDIAAIVTGVVGSEPSDLPAVVALAEGNALAAVQIASALQFGGGLTVPKVVGEAASAAWGTLSESARRLLWIAAIAGRRVDLRLLVKVFSELVDQAGRAVDRAVIEAEQTGLVRVIEHDLVFRHELERRWLVESVPPVLRQEAHTLVALALTDSKGPGSAAARMGEIARHWSAAGEHAKSASACLDAVQTAAPVPFGEVLDHVEQALRELDRVMHPPTPVITRLPSLVDPVAAAARWAGQAARGAALLRSLVPRLDDDAVVLAWERIGWLERETGDRHAAAQAYARALSEPATGRTRIRVLAGAAAFELTGSNLVEAERLCADGLSLCRGEMSAERASLLCTRGVLRVHRGDIDSGLADLDQSRLVADIAGSPENYWRYLGNVTFVLQNIGRATEAVDVALKGVQRAEVTGIVASTTVLPVISNTACAMLALGRWDEALGLMAKVPFHDGENGVAGAVMLIVEAEIRVCRGQFEAADAVLREADRLVALDPAPDMVGHCCRIRAERSYWANDLASADAEIARGLVILTATPDETVLQLQRVRARLAADAVSTRRADRIAVATRLRDDLDQVWATIVDPGNDAFAARATVIAELARIKGEGSSPDWSAAISAWESAVDPFSVAYSRFRFAESVAAADRRRAASALATARRESIHLGARPLVAAIDALARRTRLTVATDKAPASGPKVDSRLTDREAAVLDELAHGRTNRQIARRLAISERTVGVHVSHILAKLGVSSRVEAAAIAYRRGPEPQ